MSNPQATTSRARATYESLPIGAAASVELASARSLEEFQDEVRDVLAMAEDGLVQVQEPHYEDSKAGKHIDVMPFIRLR
jgi:hypothetical protein